MPKNTTRYLLVAAIVGALASWSFSAATQAPPLPPAPLHLADGLR